MIRDLESNMFAAAMNAEIREIREHSSSDEAQSHLTINKNGHVTLPVAQYVGTEFRPSRMKSNNAQYNSERHLEKVLDISHVKSIENATPELLFNILEEAFKTLPTTLPFFGLIISTKTQKINPLHPLIAQQIQLGHLKLPDIFTLNIYPAVSHSKIDSRHVENNIAAIVKILEMVPSSAIKASVSIKPAHELNHDLKDLRSATFMQRKIQMHVSGRNPDFVLTPVQFHVKSLISPWYGLVTSKYSGGTYTSLNLFPYLTGNVNAGAGTTLGSTCTGSLSPNNYTSLEVLNRLNSESTFSQSSVPQTDKFAFPLACQSLSSALILSTRNPPKEKTDGKK